MNQNFYNSDSLGFDQTQTPQFLVIHPPPQETGIEILHDHENVINSVQTFLRKFNRYSFFETPKELAEYINTPGWNRLAFYDDDDDDDVDYTIAITPVLSTEEPDNSLSMGDEHLDTIPATESDEVIKSSVENLVLIQSEFEGFPDTMCDVHLINNPTPLEAKDHFEIVINSNDDISSSDDDSLYKENIKYVEASPHDSEVVSLEVAEIVILEDEEIKDDNLREKLLNEKLLQQEQWAYLSTHPPKRLTSFCYDDDDDYDSAITPILSTEEPVDSLSMGDEHLDTIPATESDEVIKSSVENLVPIPNQFEDFSESNNEVSSIDDDSFSIVNIDYVEASPPDSELVSSEVMEIVIPEVGGIDDDIPLTIKDDNLRDKLLNVNLLIATIEALNNNPTLSFDCETKSSSTSLNSLLEETSTFHNSLPEFENFYFDLREISSGSTTTHSDISLPDYEAFYFDDDHIKEISSGSSNTHSDISLSEYDSFIFEEFVDELAHIISPPEYDCFYFRDLPDPGELMSVLNSGIRENLLSTSLVTLPIEDDHSPLLAYVVWIFVAFLTYPVIPPYLHPFGSEDTIFDPGITINHFYSFKPGLSHRHGAFMKFNTHRKCLSCGALYTGDFCCSKGNVEDKILVPKLPKNCAMCAKCGHPVNGPYCQGCTLLREKLEEDLVTYFQNFQNTSESSDGSTNVVNAPREPVIVKHDHGVNPPNIDECCCECGDALDGIFCQQCTCKSCGKGAHIGYNCPPKVPIISNPKPCNQTMNKEPP
nr:hypothetical protein [Tanacetum cinerariifolium]